MTSRDLVTANLRRLLIDYAMRTPGPESEALADLACAAQLGGPETTLTRAERASLLRRYLRGDRLPDDATRDRLAAALGVDVVEFYRPVKVGEG